MSVRFALRELTREAHDRVDALLSRFDLTDRDQYGDFLSVQAAAFLPVEAALDAAGAADLLADWPQRRRGDALRADLAALGRPVPNPIAPPSYSGAPAIWGGMYVLEGSRLGGAMLHKTVPDDFPGRFMAPPPDRTLWPRFLEELERNNDADVLRQRAGASAIATFACFEYAYDKGRNA